MCTVSKGGEERENNKEGKNYRKRMVEKERKEERTREKETYKIAKERKTC